MKPEDAAVLERVYLTTRQRRIRLRDWEKLRAFTITDDSIQLLIETYEVKVLVREDRYLRHGHRFLFYKMLPSGKWVVDFDETHWDDEFEPFVFEKIGRRKTAEEFIEQREWEKLCARPGTPRTPLDSYGRVLSGPTSKKMERYW